tara:strand:- start:4435 stop:4743 length:309 start_codon:yes stop_codon:yes gene_type:complete
MKNGPQQINVLNSYPMSRRRFVTGIAAGSALVGLGLGMSMGMGMGSSLSMASSSERVQPTILKGKEVDLNIAYAPVNFTGKHRMATAINGSVPGPTLRWPLA